MKERERERWGRRGQLGEEEMKIKGNVILENVGIKQ